MPAVKKGGLGRGLESLFDDNGIDESTAVKLPVRDIEPNRAQPRQEFDETALAELSLSVAENGILQPILVRPMPGGAYQIVAGERRWRAAQAAGLNEMPVVIREMSDEEAMVFALIENLQREDLNAIEEARGYRSLMDEFNLTQEEAASRVGKSRSAVTNALRLLRLPTPVQELLREKRLTEGHARALLGLEDDTSLLPMAREIADKGLNVRDSEKLVKCRNTEAVRPAPHVLPPEMRPPELFEEVRLSLEEAMGRKIKINAKTYDSGQLIVEFFSLEELTEMARALGGM